MTSQNGFGTNNVNDDHTLEGKATIFNSSLAQKGCRVEKIPNHPATITNTANIIKPPGLRMMTKISDDDGSKNFNRTISNKSNDQPADEHTPSTSSSTLSLDSVSSVKNSVHELNKASLYTQESLKDVIAKMEYKNANDFSSKDSGNISIERNVNANKGACSTMNSVKKLEDIISINDVLQLTQIEMDQILSPSTSRIKSEQEIIEKLSSLLLNIDSAITITKFGSVTYGFGGTSTNFNILVTAGKIDSLIIEIEIEIRFENIFFKNSSVYI